MSSSRGTNAVLAILLTVALAAGSLGTTSASAGASRTEIVLTVKGCNGCSITPVQTKNGTVSYWGNERQVTDRQVRFRVPTSRTDHMSFLVYAPFDDIAQEGIPLTPVTQYKRKRAGSHVDWKYARESHRASACWSGTAKETIRNTLVIKKLSAGGRTVAGGFFKRTMNSGKFWVRIKRANYHSSDPSMCP